MSSEIQKIREQDMPNDYYPPKDLANVIWGKCFAYQDLEVNGIKEKIRETCFLIEKIYKIQELTKNND
jgi:hypothetical protein